jgi:hypothetical protein
MEKAIVKFNGGNLAMLCNNCRVIIKTGVDFTKEEIEYTFSKGTYLPPQYCEQCALKDTNSNEKV